MSEALPYTAQVVDEIAVVRSAQTDAINHAPAQIFMNTRFDAIRASERRRVGDLRAWQRVAGFAGVRRNMSSAGGLSGGSSNFGCGFLPTIYQGVAFRKSGDPISRRIRAASRRKCSANRWTP